MPRYRTLAFALSASIFAASGAPLGAVAQTQPPGQPAAPSPAPLPASSPASGQPASGQPSQPASGQPNPTSAQPTSGQPGQTNPAQPTTGAPGNGAQPGTGGPTGAQQPMASPAPSGPQPAAGQPSTGSLGQPSGQPTSGQQPATGQPATGGGAQAAPGSNIQGGGLPPPPQPLTLPAVPDLGQALSVPINVLPNADLIGVQQQPFVGLTLQDAIAMALQRNTELAVAQSNRRIANYQIVAARGAYDVRFQLVPSYSHEVSPVLSPFNTTASGGPVTTDTAGATAGIAGITQQGGQYNAGLRATRVTSDSAYNSYNPYYETALQLAFTQPLGRGRALDQTRLQIQLQQTNSVLQNSNALLQASNTVVQVADAYYDLVSAWQNVGIQEQGLRQASAQAASNRRLAARGATAPTDIVEANTQVNVFQDNVFAAIQNVQRVQTQIKSLILANPGDPVWLSNLVPTTPTAQIPVEPSLSALITGAIQNRPEIAQLRAQRQQTELNLAFARDQLKPQVDLALGATSNGFAGNPLSASANPLFSLLGQIAPPGALASFPPPPAYQTGRLGQSFQNALDVRFPAYSTQLTFSVPIGNHTAKADVAIAQEQQRQVGINETALVQRVRSEAINAIQGLRSAEYRVIAARAARTAAERVLLGEQRRFQAGTSTTFLVLQRQLEVANDRGRELQAQIDLDKAIVELNRVSGGVFAQNGIDVTALGGTTLGGTGTTSTLPAPQPAGPTTPGAATPGTAQPSPLPRRPR